MSDLITLGIDNLVVDLDEIFPQLPEGNIYIALTGGAESTILLYLMQEKYSKSNLIACTYRYGDRRLWEFDTAKKIADMFNIKHIEAGYLANSAIMAASLPTSKEYFNRENGVFNNVRKDPKFVAGFTGKNTTTLDPENITPNEQSKYLQWFNVHRPFLKMDKHHTIDLFYKLGAEPLLQHTYSCQTGNQNMHCGECHACFERIDAFDRLGKKDPAIYMQDYDLLVRQVRESFHIKWPRKIKESP